MGITSTFWGVNVPFVRKYRYFYLKPLHIEWVENSARSDEELWKSLLLSV